MDASGQRNAANREQLMRKMVRTALVVMVVLCGRVIPDATAQSPALELTILGSGGPRAYGRAASGNLVSLDGKPRLLIDAGSGIFTRLGELRVDLTDLDTILLTHLHIDHAADVPSVLKARAMISQQPISFRVYGPAALGAYPATTRFMSLLFGPGGAFAYQKTFGAPEAIAAFDLPTALGTPRMELISEGDLKVSAIPTRHGDAPATAYRVEYKGHTLTFSGDIDPTGLPNLTVLAQDADVLVFNCAVLNPPGSPPDLYSRHTPPALIGPLARHAHVKRLVLTHIAPLVEKQLPEVLKSVQASYNGLVTVAADKMRIAVQ
jgi:ribonuclease BN (tRNA processing enzyme)